MHSIVVGLSTWIERSLERLEWLEGERERLAAEGPTAAALLVECDTEIAALYEVLEGAAADEDEAVPAAVPDEYTLTFIEHVGWTTFRDLEPLPPPLTIAIDDVDEPWEGHSLGWRFMVPVAAALLLIVGVGAWLGLRPNEAVASSPIAEPTRQIDAAAIPIDTQEPKAARGIDADRTPALGLDAAAAAPAPAPVRNKRAAPKRAQPPSSHAIDLGKSREPLAGL